MHKFTLILILSIISVVFASLFLGMYLSQKQSQTILNSGKNEDINKQSTYNNYSKNDYDLAINGNKIILLYYFSNWCGDCNIQNNINSEVYNELQDNNIVGFKIHILDSETTLESDALAKKFSVNKEQTFILLDRNGVVNYKNTGILNKDLLKQKMLEVIKQ